MQIEEEEEERKVGDSQSNSKPTKGIGFHQKSNSSSGLIPTKMPSQAQLKPVEVDSYRLQEENQLQQQQLNGGESQLLATESSDQSYSIN